MEGIILLTREKFVEGMVKVMRFGDFRSKNEEAFDPGCFLINYPLNKAGLFFYGIDFQIEVARF